MNRKSLMMVVAAVATCGFVSCTTPGGGGGPGSRVAEPLRLVECGSIQGADSLRACLTDPKGTLVLEDIDTLAPDLQGTLAEAMGRAEVPLPRLIATMRADPRGSGIGTPLRADVFYAFSTLSIALSSDNYKFPPTTIRITHVISVRRGVLGRLPPLPWGTGGEKSPEGI